MIVVYWSKLEGETLVPFMENFPESVTQLTDMLVRCNELRKTGALFVTSTSHHCDGADIIQDGKLPNGQSYTWKKHRL